MRRWLVAFAILGAACTAGAGGPQTPPAPAQEVLVLLRLPPAHFHPDGTYSGAYGDTMGRAARQGIAARIARDSKLTLVTDWPMPAIGVDCYVMAVPPERSPRDVAQALSHDSRVEWAQPMGIFRARGGGDPLYAAQPAALAWRLSELHEISTGRGVSVAVVDSAIETTHPDLAGQVSLSENFVDDGPLAAESHGTAVAGIIAARADNGMGIVGVAPRAALLGLRACWEAGPDDTLCSTLSLAKALQFAILRGAQVINMSLSGPDDRLLGRLLDEAIARGSTVVAAADKTLPGGGFPANHPGVISVASDPATQSASLVAPGVDVPTTLVGGTWGVVSGASYAAAHVSGLVALVRAAKPDRASPERIASIVVTGPARTIDTCATLRRASGQSAWACTLAFVEPRTTRR